MSELRAKLQALADAPGVLNPFKSPTSRGPGYGSHDRAHAAPPGTGPEGETCKSCAHLYRNRMAKIYLKCALRRAHWTGGAGTDVRARDPACARWEPANNPPTSEKD